MGARDESLPESGVCEAARAELPVPEEPLPDLLGLDLAELGSIEHPVLREVLTGLRERAAQPSEMLWGFNNAM